MAREDRGGPLEQAAAASLLSPATHGLALLLHNLADLDGRVEELCGAPVEADGLALVELAFAVVGGDALLLAGILQTIPRSQYWFKPSDTEGTKRRTYRL